MSDEEEFEKTMEWFAQFEGVTPRTIGVLPRKAITALKDGIEKTYVPKTQIKEDYMKKETVEQKYIPKAEFERVEASHKDEVENIKVSYVLPESKDVKCKNCEGDMKTPLYDSNRVPYMVEYCIYCGADLNPPPEPKVPIKIKKYIPKPPMTKNDSTRIYHKRRAWIGQNL
jgi:hypothetical protein